MRLLSPSRHRVAIAAILIGLAFALFNQLGVPLRASHGARVTADEPFYLLTTVSLIEDGDLDLANDYEQRRYRAYYDHLEDLWRQSAPTPDGRLLSPHNLGTSLFILPAYALGGLDGVKRFLALLGGITIAFTFLLAWRATGDLRASFLAATLLGISAPVFVYSTQIYPESPAALLIAVSLWLLLGSRRDWRGALWLALAANGLIWLGAKYGVVASALVLAGLVRLDNRARLLLLGLLVPTTAAYAWFHLSTYGGLTPYAVNALYAGNDTASLLGLHLEIRNRLYRLAGLWADGEFGLIRWAPILLLALPALPVLARRSGPERWMLPAIFGSQFLVAVFLSITMRGWWFPGRMVVAVLPLLAVPLAEAIHLAQGRRWLAALVAGLGLYTLGVTLALREAASAELVALAVDPFALPWRPFQLAAGLFPVYTVYQASTWILTAAWTLAAITLVLLGFRLTRNVPLSALNPSRPENIPAGASGEVER
ncbi:MAG: hypothetical protein HYX94_06010 [Chloroflexi bacterium]|nr:hypothetical protein [Chloroflexota bacterium]